MAVVCYTRENLVCSVSLQPLVFKFCKKKCVLVVYVYFEESAFHFLQTRAVFSPNKVLAKVNSVHVGSTYVSVWCPLEIFQDFLNFICSILLLVLACVSMFQ